MNWKELYEMIRLHHKYLRRGILLMFGSTIPFFLGSLINYLLVPTIGLSIRWQIFGLTLIITAIVLVMLAILSLIKGFYWNKKFKKSLEDPLWATYAEEQWERVRRQQE